MTKCHKYKTDASLLVLNFGHSCFDIVSNFEIRISDFGFTSCGNSWKQHSKKPPPKSGGLIVNPCKAHEKLYALSFLTRLAAKRLGSVSPVTISAVIS